MAAPKVRKLSNEALNGNNEIQAANPRYQPKRAELEERIHLPGKSPEEVAKIILNVGAPRKES